MYLLDTNHCSFLLEGRADVMAALRSKGSALVATTFITEGELFFMAAQSAQVEHNAARVEAFLNGIQRFALDTETARAYGELKAAVFARFGPKEKSKRRGVTLAQLGVSENDLWIAAVALRHGLIVVSSDSDFARLGQVCALSVENWLA